MLRSGVLLGFGVLLLWLVACTPANVGNDRIVIGDISTYAGYEAFTVPYRNGWALAVSEINADGGINGRSLVVLSRDDNGDARNAVDIARQLSNENGVSALFGTAMFGVANTLSEYAEQEGIVFLASLPMDDALLASADREFTFRLRPSSRMQAAMLAHEAAKLPARRWATLAPNYALGWDAVSSFQTTLQGLRPDVEFVQSHWPERFKFDAKTVVAAIDAADVDGIFNATFGADLGSFVSGGIDIDLFDDKTVVSLLAGEPEYASFLDPAALSAGWLVSGYPPQKPKSDLHRNFVQNYTDRYGAGPSLLALNGYTTLRVIAAALSKSNGDHPDDLRDALVKIRLNTPAGVVEFRDIDHQSTMGAWIGWLSVSGDSIVLAKHYYADGRDYMPVYPAP